MPRVSVIIPAYNHEKYVAEAIRSVLEQTYQDFEIVITDDGSKDGTVEEIRRFNDPRIRLFTLEKNQGAPVATAKCVKESTGEFIAVLNSDDMFMRNKLELQVKFLDEHPDMWAVFGYAKAVDEDGREIEDAKIFFRFFNQPNRSRTEWLNYFFFKGNALCHPTVLARNECYRTISPPDPRSVQLGDFNRWIRICLKHEISIIQDPLVRFRLMRDERNASGNRPDVNKRTAFELSEVLKNFLELAPDDAYKVFPNAVRPNSQGGIGRELVPFIVAMQALEVDSSVYRYFGISTLYKLLGDPATAAQLKEKFDFGHTDFTRLTGKHDVFNALGQMDKTRLEEKEKQVNDMLNSASWKITAPLRAAASILKKS